MKGKLSAALLVATCLAAIAAPAEASYPPAQNGLIAWHEDVANDENAIVVANNDGTGAKFLTKDLPGSETSPSFTPNGRQIVFDRGIGFGQTDIWIMNVDGSDPHPLVATPEFEGNSALSPDGRSIAFGRNGHIILRDLATGVERDLTPNDADFSHDPDFTPDGRRIFYGGKGAVASTDLFSIGVFNGVKTLLTPKNPDFLDGSVSVSPRRDRIAYYSYDGSTEDIVEAGIDGSGEHKLAPSPKRDLEPVYSPDGKQIIFETDRGEAASNHFDLWSMNADGTNLRNLQPNDDPNSGQAEVAWQYIYLCHGKRATIVGSDGNDRINGTPGRDVIVANGGKDRIDAGGGKDTVCGNRGPDRIKGGKGNDRLYGGLGKDRVSGGPGRDVATGGQPRRSPF